MDAAEAQAREPTRFPVKRLLLDKDNPRFGTLDGKRASQADILDHIVNTFGVDDVLSSLAVNGYFEAEPLVCRLVKGTDQAVVIEGNRRLAACLILMGDERAARQQNRTRQFQSIWKSHGQKQIDPAPVIVFEGDERNPSILSYLGVRHIVSAQPWDSYAKAAWVARVVENSELTVADVSLMIGDQHRTIERLLEGYYFISQLIDSGDFRPEDSQRKGRGSVTDYPFSWVYTILGYSAVRNFLGLKEDEQAPASEPVPKKNLAKAALVTHAMFGDRAKGKSAAISDSRELGDLAAALSDSEKVALLEQGKTLEQIARSTQPIEERLRKGLIEVRQIQSDLLAGITELGVPAHVAEPFLDQAQKNRRLANELEKKLREATFGADTDD